MSILPVGVVVRLQLRAIMRMIMRLQRVVGVIVLVPLFTRAMLVPVAMLMGVRVNVRVRMLVIVNDFTVAMLMPVCMDVLVLVPVLVLMPGFVVTAHEGISFACLDLHDRDRQFRGFPAVRGIRTALIQGTRAASGLQRPPRNAPAAQEPCRSRGRSRSRHPARLCPSQHPRARRRRGGYRQSASLPVLTPVGREAPASS